MQACCGTTCKEGMGCVFFKCHFWHGRSQLMEERPRCFQCRWNASFLSLKSALTSPSPFQEKHIDMSIIVCLMAKGCCWTNGSAPKIQRWTQFSRNKTAMACHILGTLEPHQMPSWIDGPPPRYNFCRTPGIHLQKGTAGKFNKAALEMQNTRYDDQ